MCLTAASLRAHDLQRGTQADDFGEILIGEFSDAGPAAGVEYHEPLAFQLDQGFANGHPAHIQPGRHGCFGQGLAGK